MQKKAFFLKDRLNDAQIEKFKLFDDEELIFACREHWLPVVLRILKETFIGLFLAAAFSSIAFFILHSIVLAVMSLWLLLLITGTQCIRDLIQWSLHLYIATNKQIIEVQYTPLLSHAVNSVLLDQIRCTEIDVSMNGIIPELIGIGDVEITFDRPTHKEEFVIKSIRSPRYIANMLSAQIHKAIPQTQVQSQPQVQIQQPVWVKELKTNKYRFLGDNSYGLSTN